MSVAVPTVSIAQYVGRLAGEAIQVGTYAPILGRISRVLDDLKRLPATGVDRPPAGFDRHKDLLRASLRKVLEEHERPDYLPQRPIGFAGGCPANWEDLRVTAAGLKTLTDAERHRKPLNRDRVRVSPALLFPDTLEDRLAANPFSKDPIRQSVFAPRNEGVRQTAAIRALTTATGPLSFDEYVMGIYSWRNNIETLGPFLSHQGFDVVRQEEGASIRIRARRQPQTEITLTQESPENLGTELAAKAMLFGLLGSTLGEGWFGGYQCLTGGMQIARLEIKIGGDLRQEDEVQPVERNVAFALRTRSGDLAASISLKKIADQLFPEGRYQETELPSEQQWFEACLHAMTVGLSVFTQGEGGMPIDLREKETVKLFDSILPWTVLYTAQTFVDSLRGWAVRDRGYPPTETV